MKRIILTALILLVAVGYYTYDQKENNTKTTTEDKTSINYRVEEKQNLIVEESENLKEESTVQEENKTSSTEFTSYIESINQDIETLAAKEDLTVLDKATLKNTFITLTDFIFYNGQIKGTTFDKLANDAKQKVITLYEKIDAKIESVYPNYKENIKETTIKTYQNITDKLTELKDTIANNYKAEIGEENYNDQLETFEESKETMKESFQPVVDEIIEQSKNAYEKTKEELNNWYQTWKEENN